MVPAGPNHYDVVMEKDKTQLDRFKEAARELGTDDDEARFNEKLRKLVKQKPKDDKASSD
ncbi:hypothetical protein SAMN06265173_12811 [Thalassovita litoralis]|uniref:Uncharacterized protein n=1 Tax=Thalassovita litoralis TaxID=1010611 RepID=A0A521FER0_9RHOB|nr:hypothetical protein SAMN06265173_12811 [Thalassovita litoralis]